MSKKLSSAILIPYENQWVALSPDRKKVLAANKDLEKLHKKLEKEKIKDAILHFVLPFDRYYSF